jgi:hypothetical protein
MDAYLKDFKFGRVTVLHPSDRVRSHSPVECRCECGKTFFTEAYRLKHGITQSCGCLRRERNRQSGKARATHGLSKHPLYRVWSKMLGRCFCKTNKKYPIYGGRGVTVCERWRSFPNFLSDVGERPSPYHSLDRIDTNGNYEPSNVRWATQDTQQNNRRDNRLFTIGGQTKTSAEWARKYGVSPNLVRQRVDRNGWPIEKALGLVTRPDGSWEELEV